MGMALATPRYTVDDLEQFPNDRQRYELLEGVLFVTPAPRLSHDRIVSRLVRNLIRSLPDSVAVHTGGVISRPPGTQLEPDLLVLLDAPGLLEWKDLSDHWLVVEVLSRSTRTRDRGVKRAAYFALGVREVWLVDPVSRTVEVCRSATESEVFSDVVRWKVPTLDLVVTVELAELFGAPSESTAD